MKAKLGHGLVRVFMSIFFLDFWIHTTATIDVCRQLNILGWRLLQQKGLKAEF